MRPVLLTTASSSRAWSRLLCVSERLASSSAVSGCRRNRLSIISAIFMSQSMVNHGASRIRGRPDSLRGHSGTLAQASAITHEGGLIA